MQFRSRGIRGPSRDPLVGCRGRSPGRPDPQPVVSAMDFWRPKP